MTAHHSQSRLRVIHVVLQLDTGGMEKLLVEFARRADRTRFDLRFVSMTSRGPVAQELENLGFAVEALDLPPGFRPALVFRMAWYFRRWQADVVHVHNTKPLIYCGPAARLARVPRVIYTRHGQRHGQSGRRNVLFRLAARTVDAAVCVSKDSAARSTKEGLRADRIHTVWNGIDTTQFAYSGPCAGGPAVMVGRLSPEKDVETLLDAAKIVLSRQPSFRLKIAGNGSEFDKLRRASSARGLGRAVDFLGHVDNVAELLAKSSMCVLSSITEGISLTLLQAMSRGLPVVATDVGGNPEIVLQGATGLLVPPKDPEKLAEAMLKVWCDPELGRRFGHEGSRRVETHFDVRRMVAEYEKLYLEPSVVGKPFLNQLPAYDSAV